MEAKRTARIGTGHAGMYWWQRSLARSGKHPGAAAGTVFLLAVVVYLNTLPCGFFMDDTAIVRDNPLVGRLSSIPGFFLQDYWAPYFSRGLYRPLTMTSYAVNRAVLGHEAWGYHLVNILLHGLVSVLLFQVARSLSGSLKVSFLAASFFAVHPVHTEAVAGIVGRAELLAAAFFLAGWWLHVRSSQTARWAGPLSALAYLAGLLSKESAAPLLAVLIAGDLLLKTGPLRNRMQSRILWHAAALALYLCGRHLATGLVEQAAVSASRLDNPLAHASTLARMAGSIVIGGRYLRLLVFPGRLSVDYSLAETHVQAAFFSPGVLVSLACGCLIVAGGILAARRHAFLSLAVFQGCIGFALVSNFAFPIGTSMAERLVYLPSIGFCLAAAYLVTSLCARTGRPFARTACMMIVALVLVASGARTISRNQDWRDPQRLYERSLEAAPASIRIHLYLAQREMVKGRLERARSLAARALALDGEVPETWIVLGLIQGSSGNHSDAKNSFARAVQLGPLLPEAHLNLGKALFYLGDLQGAEAQIRQALSLRRFMPAGWVTLGTLAQTQGRPAQAEAAYRTALSQDPGGMTDAKQRLRALEERGRAEDR